MSSSIGVTTILCRVARSRARCARSVRSQEVRATFCIFDGPSPEAIRQSAARNGLPIDSIVRRARTRPLTSTTQRPRRTSCARSSSSSSPPQPSPSARPHEARCGDCARSTVHAMGSCRRPRRSSRRSGRCPFRVHEVRHVACVAATRAGYRTIVTQHIQDWFALMHRSSPGSRRDGQTMADYVSVVLLAAHRLRLGVHPRLRRSRPACRQHHERSDSRRRLHHLGTPSERGLHGALLNSPQRPRPSAPGRGRAVSCLRASAWSGSRRAWPR